MKLSTTRRTDLLHDVTVRTATNRMDAHNLAIVIAPNLVSSSNPIVDVAICTVPLKAGSPATPLLPPSVAHLSETLVASDSKTTLGAIVKLCIERYYEIFDEVPDRSEAISHSRSPFREGVDIAPASRFADASQFAGYPVSAASSMPVVSRMRESLMGAVRNRESISRNVQRDSVMFDDDEEIDDAMLVMPIGPPGGVRNAVAAFEQNNTNSNNFGGDRPAPYKARQRAPAPAKTSSGPTAWSVYNASANTLTNGAGAYGTAGRTRSTISIERGIPGGRRESISIGRGTLGSNKASGAGVEALGATAAGFFSSPDPAGSSGGGPAPST